MISRKESIHPRFAIYERPVFRCLQSPRGLEVDVSVPLNHMAFHELDTSEDFFSALLSRSFEAVLEHPQELHLATSKSERHTLRPPIILDAAQSSPTIISATPDLTAFRYHSTQATLLLPASPPHATSQQSRTPKLKLCQMGPSTTKAPEKGGRSKSGEEREGVECPVVQECAEQVVDVDEDEEEC